MTITRINVSLLVLIAMLLAVPILAQGAPDQTPFGSGLTDFGAQSINTTFDSTGRTFGLNASASTFEHTIHIVPASGATGSLNVRLFYR